MKRELKCPNCNKTFTVDEADYASIVTQVKNAEFQAEIERQVKEINSRFRLEQDLATERVKNDFQNQLVQKEHDWESKEREFEKLKFEKESEIEQLKSRINLFEEQKKNEIALAISNKDQIIAQLSATIKETDLKVQTRLLEERNKSNQKQTGGNHYGIPCQ